MRRRAGRKNGRKAHKTTERPTKGQRDITGRTVVCLLPATRGIDPVCHAALVFGAQTFVKTCPACPRRPIIVDSKDNSKERQRGMRGRREGER